MGHLAAYIVKACNLRTLVVLAALWLMFDPLGLPSGLNRLGQSMEQSLLRVGLDFQALPTVTAEITVIHVPTIEYDHWLDDLPGASRLALLLDKLYGSPTSRGGDRTLVGLVLEQPMTLIQPEAESLLAEIQQGRRTTDHLFDSANELLQRREKLLSYLNSDRIVLGLHDRVANQYRVINKVPGPLARYAPTLVNWLWRAPPQVSPDLLSPVLHYVPLPSAYTEKQYLLVRDQERYLATFWTQFLALQQHSDTQEEESKTGIQWLRHAGVKIDDKLIVAGTDAGFVPVYGHLSGIRAPLRQITLGAALSLTSIEGWILLGRDGSDSLEQTAQVLASLSDSAYFVVPLWWPVGEKAILLVVALFMGFVLPFVSGRWVVGGTLGLGLSIVGVQLGGQISSGLWLPTGTILVYLCLAFGGMLVWRWQRIYWNRLVRRGDLASLRMANTLVGSGDLQQALVFAQDCRRTSPELLEQLYSIAEGFEQDQRWPEAVVSWSELNRRRRRYRDAHSRLKMAREMLVKLEHREVSELAPPNVAEVHRLDNTFKLTELAPAVQTKPSFGRYQVRQEIGRGASGTVFLGFDPLISREVAIKTIQYQRFTADELADVRSRFFREAEAAGRLSHPNIVPVYDIGEQDGFAYIAMDFAKGRPLSDFIHPDRLLPVFVVYRIALEVAEALSYAHEHKIVHRDIKPGNVLYNSAPFCVRITDFGIARFVDHSHTRTGEILGSPLYMSPEQVLGHKVGASSDLFSLGVMFYQLLTGSLPFSGDSLASVTYEIVHCKHRGARSLRKELPASATRITNVSLQKKPAERYQSAGEMAEALRKALRRDFATEVKQHGLPI